MPGEEDFDILINLTINLSNSLCAIYTIIVLVVIIFFSAGGIKLLLDYSDGRIQFEKSGHFNLSVR